MAATAMLSGDLDAVEQMARSVMDTYGRAGPWSFIGLVVFSMSHFWRGAWDEANRYCDDALALAPPETWREWVYGWRFLLRAYRGDRSWLDEYRQRHDVLFREGRTLFAGDTSFAVVAVEALAGPGEREEAYRLYPTIIELLKDGLLGDVYLTEMFAGIASTAGAQWGIAERHFETALRQAHDFPSKIAQPEVRRWYAWMLLDRDAPGDRDQARTLLNEAIELYQAIGMPRHLEMARAMLKDV